MLLFMAGIVARLWELQLIRGDSFDELSRSNRIRLVRLPPPRGSILDARGRVLGENRPSFTFSVMPGELRNTRDVIEECSAILGLTPEKMRGLLERSSSVPKFMSFPIKKNLSLEELSLIKSRASNLKGVNLEVKPFRYYPFGEALCHVAGTVGEISADELFRGARLGYRSGDLVGKSGIEKECENHLKGEEGWEEIEIDAKGRSLASLSRRPPKGGADVILTVDTDLQKFVEKTFIHRAGSVVAMDPDTGEILAMVSKPGFDPNLFSPSMSERQWRTLNSDPLHPLENRSIRGLYSPASAFKIVTAAAALAENVVKVDEQFTCKGEMELGGQVFRCWNPAGHGKVSLHKAIVESCDIYFYSVGLRLGADLIARYAALFGLGKPTGLGMAQELPGLVPTSAWKLRSYGESWKDGETLTIAIGQGYLVTTPVQLAVMTSAMANGGRVLKPAIVRQIRSPEKGVIFDYEPVVRWALPLDSRQLAILKKAFRDVVLDRKGTGRKCFIPGINVSAKTGTSQVISAKQRTGESDQIPYHERTHAIIVAYVDDRPKKLALVVIVEHGGGGGRSAAPLARKIIARYYGVPDPGDPKE